MGATDVNARRWRLAWIVAAVPAAAGAASLAVGSGDFRSSGLIAGVGLSLLLVTILLALRGPWRVHSWPRRAAGVARIGIVGVVALAALAAGIPEFLQERFGVLLTPGDVGLRSVTVVDGAFVAVGAARTGAAWVSVDATSWEPVAVPETIAGADIVDLAHVPDGVFAIARDDTDAVLLALTASVPHQWREAHRFTHDVFGIVPMAADSRGRQLVVASDIIGNDVMFFHGEPPAELDAGAPEPTFDHGYEVDDVACNAERCVAVGRRINQGAAIWHSPTGAQWDLIDVDLPGAEFVAVASTPNGFVAVGNDTTTATGVAWSSADGRAWDRLTGPRTLSAAVIDGVVVLDGVTTVFGRNTDTAAVMTWSRVDDRSWVPTVITPASPGSRLRHLAANGDVIVGVGVDTNAALGAVWSSRDGRSWTQTVLEARPDPLPVAGELDPILDTSRGRGGRRRRRATRSA